MIPCLLPRPAPNERLALADQAALFADYRARKAQNTLKRQDTDLALFGRFLESAGVSVGDLAETPEAWRGVTWGLVAAFAAWQLKQAYALSSINARLSTVKVYAKLAALAGALDPGAQALIRNVAGYAHKEEKHVNEKRTAVGIQTRKFSLKGTAIKKGAAVPLTLEQARKLKDQPDTQQGRRDRLALGLRVGELAGLTVDHFKLGEKTLTFYRQKVNKTQTMTLKFILR